MPEFFKALGELLALHGTVITAILTALVSLIALIAQVWWGKERFEAKEEQIGTLKLALSNAEKHQADLEKIKDEQIKIKEEFLLRAEQYRVEIEKVKDEQLKMKDSEIATLISLYRPSAVHEEFKSLRAILEEGKRAIEEERDLALGQKRKLEAEIQTLTAEIEVRQETALPNSSLVAQTQERDALIRQVHELEARISELQNKAESVAEPSQVVEEIKSILSDSASDEATAKFRTFGSLFKELRESQNLTYLEMAKALAEVEYPISPRTIEKYEVGTELPNAEFFVYLPKALNIPAEAISDLQNSAKAQRGIERVLEVFSNIAITLSPFIFR